MGDDSDTWLIFVALLFELVLPLTVICFIGWHTGLWIVHHIRFV
jgi:hypothetical protein